MDVKRKYEKDEITTKEYFEAIYLQISSAQTKPWVYNMNKIKSIVDEEHFDDVRKFVKQEPALKNIACYEIGKIIHLMWSPCKIQH